MYLTFPSIAPYKSLTMYHHFTYGMPTGFHVWGNLHLWGDTSDYVDQKEVVDTTVEHRSGEGLSIIFLTGKSEIAPWDLGRLDSFVSTWCQRLGWP